MNEKKVRVNTLTIHRVRNFEILDTTVAERKFNG